MLRRLILSMSMCASAAFGAEPPAERAPPDQIIAELQKIQTAQAKGSESIDTLRLAYKTLAQQRPGDVMLRVYLAFCDIPSDSGWNQLKQVLGVDSKNKWARYGLARTYNAWKMRPEARKEWDSLLAEDSGFYLAMAGLGDLARIEGDEASAEKQYRASIAVRDNPWARSALGFQLLTQGRKELAKPEFEKSLQQWPEQPKAAAALLSLYSDPQSAEAVKLLLSLAALEPKNKEARVAVARLRDSEGKTKEAAAEYERAVRLGDTSTPTVSRLAQLYRTLGDDAAEERTLELQAGSDRASPDANVRLSELALARNDAERAEGQLLEALARDQKCAQAHLQLGQLKLKQNVLHEALEAFRAGAAIGGEGTRAAASQRCAQQAEALEKQLNMPKPAAGSINSISNAVAKALAKFYTEEKKRRSIASGTLKLRVRVDEEGVVKGVDVLSDEAKDPLTLAFAYLSLRSAQFPKAKRDPVFEFDVGDVKSAAGQRKR